ncbi:MAG: Tyrosine recombinase XerC [Thermoanaerobaculia bacterium]|nr:Tyrosine recombinase XerC [Thermoanaerobaculia bacterium]
MSDSLLAGSMRRPLSPRDSPSAPVSVPVADSSIAGSGSLPTDRGGDERTGGTPSQALLPAGELPLDHLSTEALLAHPRIQLLVGQLYAGFATGVAGGSPSQSSVPGRPFAMDSLLEFERRFLARVDEEVRVEGKARTTANWRRDGLRSFARFVRANNLERAWIGGDWREQARVIKEWLAWLRQRPTRSGLMSRRSIHGYFRAVRTVVVHLAAQDGAFSPFQGIATPKQGDPERPRLLVGLVPALLEKVDHFPWGSELEAARNSCLVRLYVLGGLRRDEALTLKNGDVNRDNGDLHVIGKGPSGGKRRLVCCPTAVEVFTRYIGAKRDAGRTDDEFIVSTTRNGGIGEVSVRRILRIVSQSLGTHVTPHMLRRTAADLWREAGVPLPVIQRQLGHKHLSMTLYYSSVSDDDLRRAMSKLDVHHLDG